MQSNVLLNTFSKTIFNYTVRNYARNIKKLSNIRPRREAQNPGLQNQLNLLNEKHELKEPFTQEDFEDLETDFMDVEKADKLHKSEIEAFREKQKLWIVGRKYFKENKINFLTWNDKEQIRHLHLTNPEEWTIEKLSEGFPALPSTIAKLLKINWKPRTEYRIKNHDKHVEDNWKLLKEGKLNHLPSDVIQHALKFSNRKLTTNVGLQKIIVQPQQKKSGEYGSIIENYQKLINEKNQQCTSETSQETQIEQNNLSLTPGKKFELPEKKDRRLITLNELKEDIENKIDKHKNVDDYEKMILTDSKKLDEDLTKDSVADVAKIGGLQTYKVESSNKTLMTSEDKKVFNALNYPEKIVIPKAKYKKGATYKVNDCYYDDDGEFLYRVPGMQS